MEKRVFLAIFLSFVVLAVYQSLFAPRTPTPSTTASSTAAATTPGPEVTPAAPAQPAAQPAAPAASPLVADAQARDIVVETDAIRAVFSTAGATLKSWKLKKYLEAGEPLELVPIDVPDTLPRPFTLSTDDATISKTLATALFKPSAESLSIGHSPGTLSFDYRDASGLNARKTFYFQPEAQPYVLKVEAAVDLAGASKPVTLAWGPAIGLGFQESSRNGAGVRGVQFQGGKVAYLSPSSLQSQGHYEGELRFAGVEDHYFLSVVLAGTQRISVDYAPVTLPQHANPAQNRDFVSYRVSVPGSFGLPFFMGPKDFDILRSVDPQLVRAIDFGMFDFIVVPLLLALKRINNFVGNYGW